MRTIQKNSLKWAQPITKHSTLQRSLLVAESHVVPRKHYVVFDEIFPFKNDSTEEENLRASKKKHDDTFHRAIGPVLAVGQCFGILPVCGILCPDFTSLRFKWTSWRVVHSLIGMMGALGVCVCCFINIVSSDSGYIYKSRSLIFYGSTLLAQGLFFRLAMRWPRLVGSMARENSTGLVLRPTSKRSLRTRFSICCTVALSLALAEHLLSITSGIAVIIDCPNGMDPMKAYFINSFSEVFTVIEFEPWKAICLQFFNFSATFSWNFMDLFIIVVSMGLTDRFEQLNNRLDLVIGKHLPEQFWKIMREEFTMLSHLVREVDEAINEIVLLSFANNLFFICLQLFNTLNSSHTDDSGPRCGRSKNGPLLGYSQPLYFAFSFWYLMIRSLAVSLGAANIHSSSRKPSATLYNVPSSSYCSEVQRFLEQVTSDTIGLTGLNFFYVTRSLVLTIAGTVVTYELVLVQFNAPPPAVTANITINDTCGVPLLKI